jgi:predicted TIM-barrel fold metal-dependent hydrolase
MTDIIDFHCHHIPARFRQTAADTFPANQRARWEALARKLSSEDLLLEDIRNGDIAGRVVNIPAALIADASGRVPHETIMAMNDCLADLAARHNGRIACIASVDAYDGDVSAREAERAIKELGLRGIFVDCARGNMLINAPQARPTLEAAARLGVPVFVHPVNPQPLTDQMAPYGRIATLFARGTVNAAAMITLIEGGVFDELPELRIVVTALAFGGIAMGAAFSSQSLLPDGALATMRKHVYVDTMGFDPALIRASVDILGADKVIAGSDWPIVNDKPIAAPLATALDAAGLDAGTKQAIASGNVRKLLGL